MTGFNPHAHISGGIGDLGVARSTGFDWGGLVGDLARGWTNIGAQILVPPTYVQNAGGVEIRAGAPVLQTGVPGTAVGTAAGASGASLVTGGGQTAGGLSTNGMLLAGMGVLALVLLTQGRR